MSMGFRKNHRSGSHTRPGIGWSLVLIICLVALVLALPALAVGMVLQRLTSRRDHGVFSSGSSSHWQGQVLLSISQHMGWIG